jgi:hypothetical protein
MALRERKEEGVVESMIRSATGVRGLLLEPYEASTKLWPQSAVGLRARSQALAESSLPRSDVYEPYTSSFMAK